MLEILAQTLRPQIQAARRILVVSHVRPDGDAVGSLLGLGMSLLAVGKEVQMVLADGVPKNLRHLPGSEQVLSHPEGNFDFIIVVDCSDLLRVGETLNPYPLPNLNIDHHPTNLNFAETNWVEPTAVATAEMLADLLPMLGLPITPSVAADLLTGLITDTLGFRTSNVTPKVMRLVATLMELGGDLPQLYNHALTTRSFEAARYWGAGLSLLQREERMAWTTLTLSDRQAIGYPGRDDAELVNVISTIDDIDVAIIFVEQNNGRVKVSWRAQPGFDVSQIALRFGGGGHRPAAGADIEGGLNEVKEKVLQATRTLFDEN